MEYLKWKDSKLLSEKEKEIIANFSEEQKKENFGKYLEFGTGGMRGIMGLGTNRLNKYIIRKATQGLANYINETCGDLGREKGVVISFDCRINSSFFALESALVLCANGIKTYLFSSLGSTPELSFAVRQLRCQAGIMITASHNPKEYNGYKVYWADGGQIVEPQASGISKAVEKVDEFEDVKVMTKNQAIASKLLYMLSDELKLAYIDSVKKESVLKFNKQTDLKIVYSPLHGTGGEPVERILKKIGYKNIFMPESQVKPDGNFPTCSYANPEDKTVFDISIKMAEKIGAELCLANDPDADRLGAMVKHDNNWIYLDGNQIGILFLNYILEVSKDIPTNGAVVSTIVSTPMLDLIAKDYNLRLFKTLTGFKYIGEKIKEFENKIYDNSFVFGMEESLGFLKGTYVRDKDGILATMLFIEMFCYYKNNHKSIIDILERLYKKYGWYSGITHAIKKDGIIGMNTIKQMMDKLRRNNDKMLLGLEIKLKRDYMSRIEIDYEQKKENKLNLPISDVIQYVLKDGTYITIRPSGTEPKIKYYIYTVGKSKKDADEKLRVILNEIVEYMEIL